MTAKLKRFRKKIKNELIYLAVRAGMRWMLEVKRETAMKFMQTIGGFGFYLVKSERNKTLKNLTKIYGGQKSDKEIYSMGKQVFKNLGRYMADAFMMPRFNAENIDRYVNVDGLEHLDDALKLGRGVIALTGHIGNWELMGAFLSFKGYPINVIGAPIYDPRLDALVVKNREHSGMKYIARGDATRQILKVLRNNEVIGILIDQDTKKVDGVFADFLGHPAYTPVGPIVLAMKTKSAIVPMAIHLRNNGTHFITVRERLNLKFSGQTEHDRLYNTALCNQALSDFIRQQPTQWVWMHQRWKTQPNDIKN